MEEFNILEISKDSTFLKEIKEIYLNSFPDNERIDFEDIENLKFPDSKLYAFCKNDILLGFSYVSVLEQFAYIVYFAIDEKFRNKGYGSQLLNEICEHYKDKTKVLCIEKPQTTLQKRRFEFYKRNGFKQVDFEFELYGQVYYSLYSGEFNKTKFKKFLTMCFPLCEKFKDIS